MIEWVAQYFVLANIGEKLCKEVKKHLQKGVIHWIWSVTHTIPESNVAS